MRDLDYLNLLSKQFKNSQEVNIEIANLNAILTLPKATEYFFSDLHGEHESFIHLIRSASGVIRKKLRILFSNEMSEEEILKLANLVYFPKEKLEKYDFSDKETFDFQVSIIKKILILVKTLSEKYTRSKVRKAMNIKYAYLTEELLYKDLDTQNEKKAKYYQEIINSIIDIGLTKDYIIELCKLAQTLALDTLHIVGDIFDRGARHDRIIDELMNLKNVDIQWGNHDVEWMGAFFGNEILIINCLRIAIKYNCFDMLEDGYGINLRKLSEFASEVYRDDKCSCFMPSILDENEYDVVRPELTAKMHKTLEIIQLKLEGKLLKKHPEYGMSDRIMLEKIDYNKGVLIENGVEYKLKDNNFPTINKDNPLELTDDECELLKSLKSSFMHSKRLSEHINFVFEKGSLYKIYNNNLLFHGMIPMTDNGEFDKVKSFDGDFNYSGKELFDYFNSLISKAYNDYKSNKFDSENIDHMYYMWCGGLSPFFGRNQIKTFERYFLDDEEIKKEYENPYYYYAYKEEVAIKILNEFGLNGDGHIINGHVPVKHKDGEHPVKANGRLFIIDGGLSKGYQKKTGIAGYTLIYDSKYLSIAIHKPYEKGKFNTPVTEEIERVAKNERVYVRDTDIGRSIKRQISDLKDLLVVYREGLIKETN